MTPFGAFGALATRVERRAEALRDDITGKAPDRVIRARQADDLDAIAAIIRAEAIALAPPVEAGGACELRLPEAAE